MIVRKFLFSSSISNNVTLFKEGFEDKEVENSLRLSAFSNDLSRLEAGIETIIGEKGIDLSGGQKQRVLIARALISEPELLILDEPTAGLDYNITQEFYKILKQLNKENKLTIIMATHDIEELANDKPRIVYLSKKVVYDGNYDGWKGYEK